MATKIDNAAQVEVEVAETTTTVETNDDAQQPEQPKIINLKGKTYEEKIKTLIANGWKKKNGIKVKNVTPTEKENHDRVTFTVREGFEIDAYVENPDTHKFELKKSNFIYSSTYAIAGALKETEDMGWLANIIVEDPDSLNVLFNGGTIDIISLEVPAGTPYVNPFSSTPEFKIWEHDQIINIITNLKKGKSGERMEDMYYNAYATSWMKKK